MEQSAYPEVTPSSLKIYLLFKDIMIGNIYTHKLNGALRNFIVHSLTSLSSYWHSFYLVNESFPKHFLGTNWESAQSQNCSPLVSPVGSLVFSSLPGRQEYLAI